MFWWRHQELAGHSMQLDPMGYVACHENQISPNFITDDECACLDAVVTSVWKLFRMTVPPGFCGLHQRMAEVRQCL